jgi:tetratricopeptide (TPR) repeat protein
MKNPLVKFIIGFALPAAVILLLGKLNIWYAVAALLIYVAAFIYLSRVTVFTILGGRNYSQGKTDLALKWFKRAHESSKAGIKPSVSYAYILLKNADLVKSEEVLQKLLKKHPSDQDVPFVKSNLALVLWKKGELDASIAMLEEVLQTYKTTSVYGSLGFLLLLAGDLEKALQFNLEAHEYNSADKIILDNLGQNYFLLGMYDKSMEIYEPLVKKSPTFPEPYYNYGLLLEKQGEPEKALEMMKMALGSKFSYLSSITKEEVEAKMQEISAGLE